MYVYGTAQGRKLVRTRTGRLFSKHDISRKEREWLSARLFYSSRALEKAPLMLQNITFMMSSSSYSGNGFDFQLYRYTPSLAAAILFTVLFFLITAYHLYQVVRMRSWYMLVFVTGGICKSNLNNMAQRQEANVPSFCYSSDYWVYLSDAGS